MGLASALAAAGAAPGYSPAGAPAPGYSAPPYPQPGAPGAAPYPQPGAPGAAPYPQPGAAPYPQPGAAPYPQAGMTPPSQPAGGAPGGPAPQDRQAFSAVVAAKLRSIVDAHGLHPFYPPERLAAITQRVVGAVDFRALAARWRLPVEMAVDLSALALYDTVLYCDDSGSMESDNGEPIRDMEMIIARAAEVASLFDEDGISVRFINSGRAGDHIKDAAGASRLLAGLEYRYDTKLAQQMEARILSPLLFAKPGAPDKPLLIITVTDGEPSDKPPDRIFQTIATAQAVSMQRYGARAAFFAFAQVGKDTAAQDFLAKLDAHPVVGSIVDVTSTYELESAEWARKGINLSPEMWLVKLLVGAVDPSYDEQDEGGPQPAAPQPQAYSQPAGGWVTQQAAPHYQQQPAPHYQQQPAPHYQQQAAPYYQQQQAGGKKKGFLSKLFS